MVAKQRECSPTPQKGVANQAKRRTSNIELVNVAAAENIGVDESLMSANSGADNRIDQTVTFYCFAATLFELMKYTQR